MAAAGDYKAAKEAFVSGTTGGTVTRVNSVCLTALTTYALWTVLRSHLNVRVHSASWKTPLSEFCILVLPLLLSLTALSNFPVYLNALLLSIILAFHLSSTSHGPSHHSLPSPINSPLSPSKGAFNKSGSPNFGSPEIRPPTPRRLFSKPFVTVYRAHMMLMTIICILAVDFKVFPREFAKAETWGTSLMDLGVGSFVFSLGIVAALPLLRSREQPPIFQAMGTSVKRSFGLIVLGLVRVAMVKGVEYPEHVSEYGVHWNFFFTLAIVPIFGTILDKLARFIDYAWIAIIISGVHQLALDATQLQYWALTAERTTLLNQNREGIVSLPGYLSIYLLGISTGLYILPPDPYFHSRLLADPRKQRSEARSREVEKRMEKSWKEKPGKLASVLGSYVVLWWVAYWFLGLCGWVVSRRLANVMYVVWIAAFNTAFLFGGLAIHMWFSSPAPSPSSPSAEHPDADLVPQIFTAINRNGMVVFLAANLLTGLVNVSMRTMYASDAIGVVVMTVHYISSRGQRTGKKGRAAPMSDPFEDEFGDIDFDDSAIAELDQIAIDIASGKALPPRTNLASNLKQRDLFGGTVKPPPPPPPKAGPSRTGSLAPLAETAAKVKSTKRWDSASFARHGWSKRVAAEKKARAKGKGKAKAYGSDEEAWDDGEEDEGLEDDEDDLLDPSYDPSVPPLPIKWPPDPDTSQTWHYPVQADKPLRTYQYNIVHRAMFENTLVSLPTGLGKTFIAACVMLNFYRWYPQGRVIFLAPTRPLVAQQIQACHYIAGIPQDQCVELTGQTAPKLRAIAWATKRVFYCTPQTLERDLATGKLDPRDVVCLVVDEAHRASGDYAYCGVVRFIMSRNVHFRILALTATPGAKGEAVQAVIDNLHIGKIEVRTDESMDIKQYIHTKEYDLRVVPLGDALSAIRDRWASLMQIYLRPLLGAGLVWQKDPVMLSAYGVQIANPKIGQLPGGAKANGKYYPMVKALAAMARAMEYLVVESMTSFEEILKDIEAEGPKTLTSNADFRKLLNECRQLHAQPGYVGHPKMDTLVRMCTEYFEAAKDELDADGNPVETRVMIFCNWRAVVSELVECLNRQRPLIKATTFVGQANSKGSKGKSQKEQLETIQKFKAGVFNVLVATSIGEEGLDIGEIDLIVCYEAQKSPIRMLQRVGRTGRARDGRIIVLMSEGREEKNWEKAKESYSEVQNALVSNKVFEVYVDGDRMLPPSIKPTVDKVVITAKKLDLKALTMTGHARAEKKTTAEAKKREKAEKKQRDATKNMPRDAFDGFRTAGDFVRIGSTSKSKAVPVSPGREMRERRTAALLTLDEEQDLRERWQFSGTEKVHPTPLDLYTLPFHRGHTGTNLRVPSHSSKHLSSLAMLQLMDKLADSKPEALDKWHDKMSAAFSAKLVDLVPPSSEEQKDEKRKRRKMEVQAGASGPRRVRRPPLEIDEPSQGMPTATKPEASPTQYPFPPQAEAPVQEPVVDRLAFWGEDAEDYKADSRGELGDGPDGGFEEGPDVEMQGGSDMGEDAEDEPDERVERPARSRLEDELFGDDHDVEMVQDLKPAIESNSQEIVPASIEEDAQTEPVMQSAAREWYEDEKEEEKPLRVEDEEDEFGVDDDESWLFQVDEAQLIAAV